MTDKKPLVIITGPTAIGKTEYSIKAAKKFDGEIISADSIQVYKYMDIGSAKVTVDEMQGIRHYLIDELYPDEEFNVFVFKELAKKYVKEIHEKNKLPIIAGGTGFYIQALLYDIDFKDTEADEEYRKKLFEYAKENGNESLFELLKEKDPESAKIIHPNNVKRVIRALEFFNQKNEPISKHNEEQKKNESPYDFVYIVLNDERERVYDNINRRVDIMLKNGLIEEVQKLLDMGYSPELVSMQGIGYKETIAYLKDKDINGKDIKDLAEEIKLNTRHFAKRQLTWFRREKDVTIINYSDYNYDKDAILDAISNEISRVKSI